MDIYLLFFIGFFSLYLLSIAFRYNGPYLAVIAGIMMIFTGIAFVTEPTISKMFCAYDSSEKQIMCVDQPLTKFSFSDLFGQALGLMMMIVGAGVIVDNFIRIGEKSKRGV